MSKLLRTATSAEIVKSSLKISLVVGTILNLINQGENIFIWRAYHVASPDNELSYPLSSRKL